MSLAHSRREFLDQKIRMSHIYQPVTLEVLLTKGGTASVPSRKQKLRSVNLSWQRFR